MVLRSQGCFTWSCVPTLSHFRARHAQRKVGRAAGEDGLPAEFFKLALGLTSIMFFPAVVKASLRAETPITWRGGMICELWKGKESASLCSSYRDISIENTICKYYSAFLREHLMISYADYAKNTQCAGMAKRGTDTAMHLCRAHWPYSKFKGRNAGQLYMDLESAFASVAREIAFYGVASVESIAFIFLKLSIPPSVHRILLQSLGGQCPLRGGS